jgi:hypothetical protein
MLRVTETVPLFGCILLIRKQNVAITSRRPSATGLRAAVAGDKHSIEINCDRAQMSHTVTSQGSTQTAFAEVNDLCVKLGYRNSISARSTLPATSYFLASAPRGNQASETDVELLTES